MDKETKLVMEKTGLTKEEADIYWCFYKHADFSTESGIILPGDVKFELGRLLDEEGITSVGRQNLAQDSYDHWLNFFRRKELIAKDEVRYQHNNSSYPVLVGYQPFNDPEIYIAYRKKGDKTWGGRLSAELLSREGERMLAQGYEFKQV